MPKELHLITNVETTASTVQDVQVTESIHQSLEERGLLPKEHLVDSGYVDARLLLESPQTYGVTLIGPVQEDTSWQALARQGYDISQFVVDWQSHTVTCPQGKVSKKWNPYTETAKGEAIVVAFSPQACQDCTARSLMYSFKTGFPQHQAETPDQT